jgi:hypothetical protein
VAHNLNDNAMNMMKAGAKLKDHVYDTGAGTTQAN